MRDGRMRPPTCDHVYCSAVSSDTAPADGGDDNTRLSVLFPLTKTEKCPKTETKRKRKNKQRKPKKLK